MNRAELLWQTAKTYQENHDEFNTEKTLRDLLMVNPQHTKALRWLGVIAAKRRDFQTASQYFKQGAVYSPHDHQLHHDLALSLAKQHKFDEAKLAYEKVLKLKPDFVEALNNLASLYYRQADFNRAKDYCQKTLKLQPNYLAAIYNLALINMQQSNFDSAIKQFHRVLQLNPEHGQAHFHLANLLAQSNQFTEAIQHYEKAIQKQPALVSAYANLAALHLKQHSVDDAQKYYEIALQLDPNSLDVHFNMGVILSSQENIEKAITHYQKALEIAPDHAASLQNLGACYYKQDQASLAIDYYEKALKVTPNDTNLRYLLSALKQDQKAETAPNSYIKTLFDDYAADYDTHIQTLLYYQVPMKLLALIEEVHPLKTPTWDILDLGCGTGLMGEKLKPYARSLLGIDLSTPMLKKADEKAIYDQLTCSDIKTFIAQCDIQFDLIVAADVLGYVGKLKPIFSYLPKLLKKQGIFAFSIESLEEGDFKLQATGRFQHSMLYIQRLAKQANLTVLATKPETIRLQKGLPVKGILCLLRRRGHKINA